MENGNGSRGNATAIVGATVIDGTGAAPLPGATVLVGGTSIEAVGPSAVVGVPPGYTVVRAEGKFVTPGFIDTNVHITPFYYLDELILQRGRYESIAVETAQLLLRCGVTTIRDSYGHLPTLLAVRDAIERGAVSGPRLQVAGNIVGWGGPGSMTFDMRGPHMTSTESPGLIDARSSLLLEQIQDEFTQGVGEELIAMEAGELADAVGAYLEKGIDFLKYGGTTHAVTPAMILFSQRAQEAIVREAHRRSRRVETHATSPEGLRMALNAGIDLVQHPETLDAPMSDELAALHASSGVVCSMNVNRWTGRLWSEYVEQLERAGRQVLPERSSTSMERRLANHRRSREWWRGNATKLITHGCRISTATDTLTLPPPMVMRGDEPYTKTYYHSPGTATLDAMVGLVEVGLSPLQAITAATMNGAIAAGALPDYGTVEVGKSADLVVLEADPLADITNVRKTSMVMAQGRFVNISALPDRPVYHRTS